MTEDVLIIILFFLNQELSKQEGKPISLGFLSDNHMVEQWIMSIAGKTEDHGQG